MYVQIQGFIKHYFRHNNQKEADYIKMIHYFDNCATTRVDDEVMDIMSLYGTQKYFNPSARSTFSLDISNDIARSRETIAKALGVSDRELIFTSGGTEADNLAIFGSLRARKGNVVLTAIEHSAVFNVATELSSRGYEVRLANVLEDGHIDVDDFISKIDENTVLACFMHVSNETGAINDVRLINDLVKRANPKTVTFSDGVQAVGKIPVNLRYLGVDFYSFAGHKIHASKGVGCLYVKNGVKFSPTIFGGGQERGLRSGTENVGGIVGLSSALSTAIKSIDVNTKNFNVYKQIVRSHLAGLSDWRENCTENVSPAVMSLVFANIKGEVLLHLLEKYDIIVGTGSACSSKNKQSRLSQAIKLDKKYSEGVIRISFSKYNTLDEAELLGEKLVQCVLELRKTMSGI